jgi:hypothetical protein
VCHVHAACALAGAGSADRRGVQGDVRFPEDRAAAGGGDPGRLGQWLGDEEFAAAFGIRGRTGWPLSRLALVTVLQRAEKLTGRLAAGAVRARLDWKYLLGLSLEDPGFGHTVLAEFRGKVAEAGLEQAALDALLAKLAAGGLVKAGGKQRTDSTHVVAAVAALNRLELAGESVRAAVEAPAAACPAWLEQRICVSDWTGRYGTPMTTWRPPASRARQDELAIAYARRGPRVPPAARTGASSPCRPATWPKRRPPSAPRKQRPASRLTTPAGPASRAPCTRPSATARAGPATAACRKPASTTRTWPARSTSSGCTLTGQAPRSTGGGPATWHAWNSASPYDPNKPPGSSRKIGSEQATAEAGLEMCHRPKLTDVGHPALVADDRDSSLAEDGGALCT